MDTTPAVIARLEEVRTKLRELAKPCAANAGASDKFVQVRYSIAIESGQARTVEVSRFGGTLNDPAIESCIVDAIRNARWTMAGPDEVIPIADQIKMSELAR